MDSNSGDQNTIKLGQYIIIQRQNYTKLYKFNNITSCATLGKEQVELANINECKYFTTFKMVPKSKGRQRSYALEAVDSASSNIKDVLNIKESGVDNRNIIDDKQSQKLSAEEIMALRDTTNSSTDIVETLITNSSTFHAKTEYSQEKYLKKKEKKYFEFLTIRKPTIRLIADIMYRQDPAKVLGIRCDTLSQILTYSNVNSDGNHLLYESGTGGLLPAAILNSIGSGSTSCLIHAHPGNTAQKQALLGMNYPDEQLQRCISVNIYSVLRHYYQEEGEKVVGEVQTNETLEDSVINTNERKRKLTETEDNVDSQKVSKMAKTNDDNGDSVNKNEAEINSDNKFEKSRTSWMIDNEKACNVLRKKVDSLVITCKEHPMTIFKALLPFVNISRPFVIYSQYQEPLQECYINMRKMSNVAGVKMVTSWLRGYQVLTNRTHPDVMMGGNSGFLLTGWIVQS